jgi:hypothetical protein
LPNPTSKSAGPRCRPPGSSSTGRALETRSVVISIWDGRSIGEGFHGLMQESAPMSEDECRCFCVIRSWSSRECHQSAPTTCLSCDCPSQGAGRGGVLYHGGLPGRSELGPYTFQH